jgi:hypothetical protein
MAELEKRGLPGAYFVASNFITDAKSAASDWGVPAIRTVSLPSEKWYTLRRTAEELQPVAVQALNSITDVLTRPLNPVEANPLQPKIVDIGPAEFTVKGESLSAALENFNAHFLENHMGDGLPLVPPTAERVKWMLSGTSRSPDEVLGKCPLKLGTVTIEKIAVNAVMAGAKPEYLPVIIAAMECFVGESGHDKKGEFFFHTLGSSGAFNLMIMVNGPIAKEININSGIGLFGHGWRSNNTIGRAVRLCTINIGHCWPRENDMALTGRPSAHTWYTFAENEELSLWDPYHVTRNFKKEDSTVTMAKVNSIYSTFGGGAVGLWKAESILDQIAGRLSSRGAVYIVFNPEVNTELDKLGFTRSGVQEWLSAKAGLPAQNIHIAVAGGVPGYTVMWVLLNLNADVTKKIYGATLTQSGR